METPRIELGSKQAAKRLSTYLVSIWFSTCSWLKTIHYKLIFLNFKTQSKYLSFYLYFYDASKLNAVNQRFQETFSLRILCAEAWSYYNSDIKQLKRSYFRRLNVWNKFNEKSFQSSVCLHFHWPCCQNQSSPIFQWTRKQKYKIEIKIKVV